MKCDRERTDILLMVTWGLLFGVWYSNRERRQYVDGKIDEYGRELEGHRQRAAARTALFRGFVSLAAVVVVLLQILQTAKVF